MVSMFNFRNALTITHRLGGLCSARRLNGRFRWAPAPRMQIASEIAEIACSPRSGSSAGGERGCRRAVGACASRALQIAGGQGGCMYKRPVLPRAFDMCSPLPVPMLKRSSSSDELDGRLVRVLRHLRKIFV